MQYFQDSSSSIGGASKAASGEATVIAYDDTLRCVLFKEATNDVFKMLKVDYSAATPSISVITPTVGVIATSVDASSDVQVANDCEGIRVATKVSRSAVGTPPPNY